MFSTDSAMFAAGVGLDAVAKHLQSGLLRSELECGCARGPGDRLKLQETVLDGESEFANALAAWFSLLFLKLRYFENRPDYYISHVKPS